MSNSQRRDSGFIKIQAHEVLDTRTVVALTLGVFAAAAVLACVLLPFAS